MTNIEQNLESISTSLESINNYISEYGGSYCSGGDSIGNLSSSLDNINNSLVEQSLNSGNNYLANSYLVVVGVAIVVALVCINNNIKKLIQTIKEKN